MRLVLTVVSEEGPDLGSRSRCEFDEKGGTIGRNAQCHWSLPDPTNTISARHAVIAHNGRGFLITDVSTNGVYVNTVEAPLGRGNDALLQDGDTLYLGNYVVAVEVSRDAAPVRPEPRAEPIGARIQSAPAPASWPAANPPAADPPARDHALDMPVPVSPMAGAPESGRRAPLMGIDALFGDAPPRPAAAPAPEPPRAPMPSPPQGLRPAAAPVIPEDFLADLLGAAGGAPLPMQGARTTVGNTPAWLPRPEPKLPLPVPTPPALRGPAAPPVPLDWSLPETPPPPAAAPTPSAAPPESNRPKLPTGKSLYDDIVTLREPGRTDPEGGPALDPVAILRRRGQGAPGRESEEAIAKATPPAPPAPAPAPVTEPMPLPGARLSAGAARAQATAQPSTGAAASSALAAFWAALGLERPTDSSTEAALMGELGGALRAAVNGIVPVLAARRSLKDAIRMDQTQLQGQDNNPLKFLPSGDVVLQSLVARKLGGYLPLPAAMEQGFADIQAHEVAAVVALGAIARNMLDRLSPATIEGEGRSAKLFGRGVDKAKLWDQFVAHHSHLTDGSEENTRKLVNQEFSRAYAEQVKALKQGTR